MDANTTSYTRTCRSALPLSMQSKCAGWLRRQDESHCQSARHYGGEEGEREGECAGT